jgi:HPt (histidine-containing phosphotransfer) domain-containing protein
MNGGSDQPSSLVFDHSGMLARLMDDPELAQMVVSGFLADISKQIGKLHKCLGEQDFTTAERIAHSIKGASGNIGGMRLMDVAFLMEKTLWNKDMNAAAGHMGELENRFDQLKLAMKAGGFS